MRTVAIMLGLWCLSLPGFPGEAGAQDENPKRVILARRTPAYHLDNSRKIRGYFPANAKLEIIAERADGLVHVRFTAQSGKQVEALVRRTRLNLPARLPVLGSQPKKEDTWTEVAADAFDKGGLTDRGRRALVLEEMDWRHAQTDHFVIHFEHGIYARKVARLAEFFYHYIPEDLGGVKAIRETRSHIFIFRKPEKWKHFMTQAGEADKAWAFAFVEGMVMYLQEADKSKSSDAVLAHEMTHLILNRYYAGRPPLWLNEGLAEWYGEFGRAAFKGVKKSRRSVYKDLEGMIDLSALMAMQNYPGGKDGVLKFYSTSKYLVGFLRIAYPEEKFPVYLQDMTAGMSNAEALKKHYGITDVNQMQAEFAKFVE